MDGQADFGMDGAENFHGNSNHLFVWKATVLIVKSRSRFEGFLLFFSGVRTY